MRLSAKICLTPKLWWSGTWSVLYLSRQTTCQHYKTSYCLAVFKTWFPWKITSCLFGKYILYINWFIFFGASYVGYVSLPQTGPMVLFLAHLRPPRRLNSGSQHWYQRCRAANVAMVIRTVDERFVAMLPQWPLHWEQCWRTSNFWQTKSWRIEKRSGNHPSKQKKQNLGNMQFECIYASCFCKKIWYTSKVLSDQNGENEPSKRPLENFSTEKDAPFAGRSTTPQTPMTCKALTTTSKGTTSWWFLVFLGINWTNNWVSPKINKPSKISLEIWSFLGQPFVFPRNHHLPKRCADHNLGVTGAPNRSLPINDGGPGSPKTDQTACPLVDSGIWPTQIIPPRPATLFWSAGLPAWRDLRYPLQSEWASSNYK